MKGWHRKVREGTAGLECTPGSATSQGCEPGQVTLLPCTYETERLEVTSDEADGSSKTLLHHCLSVRFSRDRDRFGKHYLWEVDKSL